MTPEYYLHDSSMNEPLPDRLYAIIGEDHVTIVDEAGYEVAHWIEDEWQTDPTLVPTIANAVRQAYHHPQDLLMSLYGPGEWPKKRSQRDKPAWEGNEQLQEQR